MIREILFYDQFVLAAIGLFGLTRSAILLVRKFRAREE